MVSPYSAATRIHACQWAPMVSITWNMRKSCDILGYLGWRARLRDIFAKSHAVLACTFLCLAAMVLKVPLHMQMFQTHEDIPR